MTNTTKSQLNPFLLEKEKRFRKRKTALKYFFGKAFFFKERFIGNIGILIFGFSKSNTTTVKVMGIDLAGLEKNITGMCVLVLNHALELYSVRRDEEIMRKLCMKRKGVRNC